VPPERRAFIFYLDMTTSRPAAEERVPRIYEPASLRASSGKNPAPCVLPRTIHGRFHRRRGRASLPLLFAAGEVRPRRSRSQSPG